MDKSGFSGRNTEDEQRVVSSPFNRSNPSSFDTKTTLMHSTEVVGCNRFLNREI